jgi:hypothetical protein
MSRLDFITGFRSGSVGAKTVVPGLGARTLAGDIPFPGLRHLKLGPGCFAARLLRRPAFGL